MYNLEARYTHVKSHYGKAKVYEKDGYFELYSYGTLVADYSGDTLNVYGQYSQTTMRHLKDFINQYTDTYVSNNDDIRKLIQQTKERV